jgi:hypothetical protein
MKYIKKASKSATTTHQYDPWPELPKNNKFERGTQFATGSATDEFDDDHDDDTTEVIGTYKNLTIDDWDHGTVAWAEGNFPIFPFVLNSTTAKVYQKRIYDFYGVEKDRMIYVEKPAVTEHWMRSQPVPVKTGYKVSFNIDASYQNNFASDTSETFGRPAYIYVVAGSDFYGLDSSTGAWKKNNLRGIDISYAAGEDTREFHSASVESLSVPVNGDLYIVFRQTTSGSAGTYIRLRGFSIEVKPFIAGGYLQVTGESQTFTQTAQDFPDKSEAEVFLSDSGHKILKGCLLDSSGVPLTPDWYRMGMLESKSYLALINFNKFQLEQRRYWMVEGSFTGLFFEYNNNVNHPYPLSLAVIYRFTDLSDFDRRFILCAPLDMDLGAAEFTGRFYEVFIDNKIFFDGQRGGNATHKYLFE